MPKISLRKRRTRSSQQGMAMVMVLLMSSLLLVVISAGLLMARDANKDTTDTFKTEGQASNVAQAGLQDAIAWFKRHQPVQQNTATDPCMDAAFKPVYNVDPALSDTDDSNCTLTGNVLSPSCTGIRKDIQLTDHLFGRYQVQRQPCTAPVPVPYDPRAVHDITILKGKSTTFPAPTYSASSGAAQLGEGAVWQIESKGYLYFRNDFTKSNGVFVKGPDDPPNRLLSKASASIEISRLTVNTDAASITLSSNNADTFGGNCTLIGGSAGSPASAFVSYFGTNPSQNGAVLSPSTGISFKASRAAAATVTSIFSVTAAELRGMSDNIYTGLAQVPKQLPKFSITYLDGPGPYVFTNVKPLLGGGLLFVNGDLTLSDYSNSLFSGVIFVNGRLTMGRDNSLAGTVVAQSVTCNPGGGKAVIEYNANLVTTVRQKLALYRENNLTHTYRVF